MSFLSKKRTAGQPTKYRPEYCRMLIEHLKRCRTFESFVGELPEDTGVCARTLYRWVEEYPEFCQAKKRGEALGMKNWEDMAVQKAATGKGDATMIIFMLKNRYGYRDKIEIQPTHPDRAELESLSVEELEAKLLELKEAQR